MKKMGLIFKTLAVTIVLVALGVIGFAWSGLYPVAVGSGHAAPVAWLLETTRERSVAVRAGDLIVPDDLDSPERVSAGAGHYDAMCAGCHGKPGQDSADSFDPRPPTLYRYRVDPREAFWTVKHGLKMSAMPSHLDHSDRENWDTVAFVRALPEMSAGEYRELTADASHEHGGNGGHSHGSNSAEAQPGSHDAETAHSHSGDEAHDHGSGNDGHHEQTGPADHHHEMQADSPRQAIDGFRHALAEGRRDAALAYLHPRATIIEGGNIQSVDEYAAGHLGSDMAFLGQIEIEQLSTDIALGRGQATVETHSRFRGEIDGRTLDLDGAEFATLVETGDGWRISQIAWSAKPHSADEPADSNADQEKEIQAEGPHDHSAHDHSTGDNNHDH